MGYDRIETFVKNEEKPYEYCLDFESVIQPMKHLIR